LIFSGEAGCRLRRPKLNEVGTTSPGGKHAQEDGYKAHAAVESESEIITEIDVAPAGVSGGSVAPALLPKLAAEDAEIPRSRNPQRLTLFAAGCKPWPSPMRPIE
jgi:hypothetical protein